jgi:hypothetical protein
VARVHAPFETPFELELAYDSPANGFDALRFDEKVVAGKIN